MLSRDGQKEQVLAKQRGDQYFEYWTEPGQLGGQGFEFIHASVCWVPYVSVPLFCLLF